MAQNSVHEKAETRMPAFMSSADTDIERKDTAELSLTHEPNWKVSSSALAERTMKSIVQSFLGIGPITMPSVQHVPHLAVRVTVRLRVS